MPDMAAQIFWFEVLIKGTAGLVLLALPVAVAKVIGLPHGGVGFWIRILGSLLIAIAGGAYVEATRAAAGGIGYAGLALINVGGMLAFFAAIMTGQVKTVRGTIVLWTSIAVLLLLTLFEIAYI